MNGLLTMQVKVLKIEHVKYRKNTVTTLTIFEITQTPALGNFEHLAKMCFVTIIYVLHNKKHAYKTTYQG